MCNHFGTWRQSYQCVTLACVGLTGAYAFVAMTNAHPPYVMWISADGDFLYVRGLVEGYMDSVFELEELHG